MNNQSKSNKGGKRAGAGRKRKISEEDVAKLFNAGWPQAERIAVIQKLSERARNLGDVKAAGLLLAYAYGKPIERLEHTGSDGGPIENMVIIIPDNGRG